MWIETTDGGLVNSELATGVQAGRDGNRYKVDLEVVVLHQSRNSMRTIFISEDETEFKAFMDDLKTALPMLPIGDYKPKPKAKSQRQNRHPHRNRLQTRSVKTIRTRYKHMPKQCEHRKSCDLIFKRSTRQSPANPGRVARQETAKPCESCGRIA